MVKATLEQWRMFAAVVEAGGFSQAADQVHKSQSTVHHAVQKLEEILGVTLLETHGRRMQLTPSGTLMHRRALYLLTEASKIEALADVLTDGVETDLAIAVDHAFPQSTLYEAMDAVAAEHQQLCFHLRETVMSGANELLLAGVVDIAIGPFQLSDCLNEALCTVTFLAVSHPDHPLQQQSGLVLADLKPYRQIVVRDSGREQPRDDGWLGAEARWTVDHLRTSVDLVRKGLGFAWLPESMVDEGLANQTLKPLMLGEHAQRHVTFYLNFLDADALGPATRSFLGELRLRLPD